ncbi:MAG: hypothetical protein JXA06_06455 [Bacteroidetes bacterium]|nr:hypothetical protein [Bacteroidota bacterium]
MQIFLSGLLEQTRRFDLPSELIIVEWNPPTDRPPLIEALKWPKEQTPCKTRIITVPAAVHSTYPYSDKLPLFQMIAKNIGIRRAYGDFIIATNIDLLFSDELIAFLASRKLDREKMYRIDRYDAQASIPLNKTIQKQLEYCRTHIIRINTREGTFSPGYLYFKWIKERRVKISEFLHKKFPGFFKSIQGALDLMIKIFTGIRIKVFKVFRWIRVWLPYKFSFKDIFDGSKWRIFFLNRIMLLRTLIKKIFTSTNKNMHLEPPGSMLWECYWRIGMTHTDLHQDDKAVVEKNIDNKRTLLKRPYVVLHTNGCGDFTLLSKENWFMLRGYPEMPIFSFNIDSLLCYNAYYGGADEIILGDPMRMYHIEHGSGWTPEQDKELKKRMEFLGIPMLDYRECMNLAGKMFDEQQAINFNNENWGLFDKKLIEVQPYE